MADSETHEDRADEFEKYELGYHLVPSLGEEDLALRVGELKKAVETAKGKIISEGYPFSFVLSYTMKKLRGGKWDKYDSSFFGWVRFEAPRDTIVAFREALDHNEYLIRYLLIKLDPIALAPAPAPRRIVTGEVVTEPKALVKRVVEEEKTEVSEVELEKQIEQLIS
jgi:ribosomal protein S6